MITAIFLILVIAVLGAYIASVATTQHTTATLDLQGAKAYQAAYAGTQWGAYQLLQNAPGAYATACNGATYAAPTSQSLSGLAGTLSPFTVTVTCGSSSYPEGTAAVVVYQIVSTATAGAGGFQVERQLQVTLAK